MQADRAPARQRRTTVPLAVAGTVLCLLAAGPLDGHGEELPEALRLAFSAAPAKVQVAADGREVLLEFPAAVQEREVRRAAAALTPLLEGYTEGYGAVRFRLAVPVRAALIPGAHGRPGIVEVAPSRRVEPSEEDRRRLALLEARSQAREGDVDGARLRLRRLASDRPGDAEPLLALAETEAGAGRWRGALGLYDGVLRLSPEAADVARDRGALAARRGPFLRLDGSATFGPGGERAQTATVAAGLPLGEAWRTGASVQTSHDQIRGLRRSGASAAADYSGTKPLGGLDLAREWGAGVGTTRLDLFAAPQTLGAAAKHQVTTRLGETTLGALYHQPYWGTVMAFAADARRDQAGVAQTVPLPGRWQAQIGTGFVRYGVPGRDSVASGPSLLAGLSKGLPERWLPLEGSQARVGYRLEAEYLGRVATAPSGAAGPLPLLDVRAREIHSLYAEASAPLGPGTATALVGYALDRYGGGGPQLLLRYARGADSDRFGFGVEAGAEPSLDVRPRTLFHLGGFAVWRFGGR